MASSEKVILKEFPAEQAGELVGWAFTVPHEDAKGVIGGVAYGKVGEDGAELEARGPLTKSSGLADKVAVGFNVGRDDDGGKHVYELRLTQAPGAPWNQIFAREPSPWFAYGLDCQPREGTGKWYVGAEVILSGIHEQLKQNQANWFYATLYHCLALAANESSMLVDLTMYGVTNLEINDMATYISALKEVKIADRQMKKDMSAFSAVPPYRIGEAYDEARTKVRELNAQMMALAEHATLGRFLMHHQISGGLDAAGPTGALAQKNAEPAMYFLNAEQAAVDSQFEKATSLLTRLELLAAAESAKF